MEKAREAGPVHVGYQFWKKLKMDEILKQAGFSEKVRLLTLFMVMNRLISPSSEHKMAGWINSIALSDILSLDLTSLNDDALYRNLNELHPKRGIIESLLTEKEKNLLDLDDTIYLYDLTSTYFEGMCLFNPQAKRGYSRDKRFDAKQVVVGLIIDRDGFPKAHEIFPGNQKDCTTLTEMLDILEKRVGKKEGAAVVVDRGMAFQGNISEIKKKGYHYVVATRQQERNQYLDEFEKGGFHSLLRNTSSANPTKKKSGVFVKKIEKGDELLALCISEGRSEKDKAIRESHEKKGLAESLDGSYMLKTDRTDMSDDEIWRTYSLLTRCENAFRNMKSPLCERPIFHQLKRRVQTHIFLCILAYHLLVAIEKTLSDEGIHTSWLTVKDTLRTHQVATVILATTSGEILKIRKGVNAEPEHLEIYKNLSIPSEVMKPIKIWNIPDIVTERTRKLP